MLRRNFIVKASMLLGVVSIGIFLKSKFSFASKSKILERETNKVKARKIEKLVLSDQEWRKRLSDKQYEILRQEGTERSFTSELNEEKREGIYQCVGCDLELFTSKMKYDSGTGWPSFFTTIEGSFETKTDYKLFYPRNEYHCARCGGHHGHVFKDGPPPTGERWCNNGIALKFVPGKIDGYL